MDVPLQHPFSMLIAGGRGAGKTMFTKRLIQHKKEIIQPLIENIIWCHAKHQPVLHRELLQMEPTIQYVEGVPKDLDSILGERRNTLIIFDDLMNQCNDDRIEELFYRGRHDNASVIFLTQDLFRKHQRAISLNSDYMIIFKNPRDSSQFTHLAKQVSPHNVRFLQQSYHDAVKQPFSYLMIDLKPATPEKYRIRARILPDETPQNVYQPN